LPDVPRQTRQRFPCAFLRWGEFIILNRLFVPVLQSVLHKLFISMKSLSQKRPPSLPLFSRVSLVNSWAVRRTTWRGGLDGRVDGKMGKRVEKLVMVNLNQLGSRIYNLSYVDSLKRTGSFPIRLNDSGSYQSEYF
jgi:hypothetical protein